MKRNVLLFTSATDILLGSAGLLIWLGLLPVDVAAWGIPLWMAGMVGAVFTLTGLAVFMYALRLPDDNV